MRFFILISILLLSTFLSYAQRREFHPTIDIGLNGGVSFAEYEQFKGKTKVGGLSLMANTGFSRHVLEFDFANSLNNDGLVFNGSAIPNVTEYKINPNNFNLSYTFARELFAYFPACMIRNQVLMGMRLNAEIFMGSEEVSQTNSTIFSAQDYGRYSADLTLITDYHLNESNYLVLQLYVPIVTYFAYPQSIPINEERPLELDDRLDVAKNYFFKDGDLGWTNNFSKLGVNATYRVLLTEMFGLQLKYNGRINTTSQVEFTSLPGAVDIKENYHQITFGIVGHIVRPPIGF